ncbi:hypothetical protein ACFY9Q_20025 [Streptomyces sp. NPDC012389]|uniref:hypothetical protein n=1 Tax=Streptomyces sp. NPDC012389 TaxID=3364830 RepID=UPI0036E17F4F
MVEGDPTLRILQTLSYSTGVIIAWAFLPESRLFVFPVLAAGVISGVVLPHAFRRVSATGKE